MAQGTVTLWVLPLEELAFRYPCADQRGAHPGIDFNNHILIGDHPDLENVHDSCFALIWDAGWYPQYWAKFFRGYLYHAGFQPKTKLLAAAGHAEFERLRWVQVALAWDKERGYCAIYINGVQISESPSDPYINYRHEADPAGTHLYAGNTAYALGEISCYDQCLSLSEIETIFHETAKEVDLSYQKKLRDMYYGENASSFSFSPGAEWEISMELPLNRDKDLEKFYIQGRQEAPAITPEGLLITTGAELPDFDSPEADDLQQMYLWTEQSYEGDLYVTYEYMPLQEGGLSLLLTQASGLQGEDFMADYPRRTTGSMSMVCWENVRNYHWEYYREVSDVPRDSATSGLIKNPWTTPYAYFRKKEKTAKNVWHRLEFLQEGERIRGALDGVLMFDILDSGTAGHGPVYRHGHIAIRCMLQTQILFRNLCVMNRKPEFSVIAN